MSKQAILSTFERSKEIHVHKVRGTFVNYERILQYEMPNEWENIINENSLVFKTGIVLLATCSE